MRCGPDRRDYRIRWAIFALCLLMVGVWACGRKAPPVPPKRPPLPQPMEVNAWREGDTIGLSWRPGEHDRGVVRYAVLRSQWPVEAPPCESCPLVFQEVGSVDAAPETDAYTFTDRIQTDLVYSYKIEPIGSAGDRGPASNRIVVAPEQIGKTEE
jgi:hypothetical protein